MILFVLLIVFCYASGEDDLLHKCYGECGLSNRIFESTGGFPNSIPFTGQLRISYKPCPDFMIKCSAIIIDEKFIITAKKCLIFDLIAIRKHCKTTTYDQNIITIEERRYHSPENVKFYIQSNVSDENDENVFQIKTLLPLTWELAKLDVVMLELSKKIVFSTERRAACIYGGYTPTSGDILRFSGYGKVPDVSSPANDSIITTQYLKELNLSVYSDAFCTDKYVGLPSDYFCVDNNKLTIGDTGGGAYLDKDGRFYVVAIAIEAGVIFDSSTKLPELFSRYNEIMLSISPAVCKSIRRKSKGKIECAQFLSAPSKQCKNRLEEEQSRLPEEVQEGNPQNAQEVSIMGNQP